MAPLQLSRTLAKPATRLRRRHRNNSAEWFDRAETSFALACIGLFSLIISVETVHSAELKVFASRAVWTVLREVGQEFEQKTDHKLVLTTGLSFHYVDQFNAGEFDVIAAPPPELDRLIKSDKLIASSKVDLVRSVVGVVVRAGAPKPDVSSVEAFKQTS